jgi:hypothetical protein
MAGLLARVAPQKARYTTESKKAQQFQPDAN